jgi:hypothetical protein
VWGVVRERNILDREILEERGRETVSEKARDKIGGGARDLD